MARRAAWIAAAAAGFAGLVGLVGCTAATRLPNVALSASGPAAEPPTLGPFADAPPVNDLEDWSARRAPALRDAFLTEIYGAAPADAPARVLARTTLAEAAFGGLGSVEQWTIAAGPKGAKFNLVLVRPRTSPGSGAGPAPVLIAQNFCGNAAALPKVKGVARPLTPVMDGCHSAWVRPVIQTIFGRYSFAPPFEDLLRDGIASAIFYAGDVVADTPPPAEDAIAALEALTPDGVAPERRTGAIAAWAWLYSKAIDALEADPGLDPNRMAVWGHSRNGKAALLAAALDQRIDAVIALQAGTAGASLQRNGVGESIDQITANYPHWFAPAYAGWAGREDALPVDQHQLLALIAPRPVLIGAARRDAWSDPHGAFRAAEAADPAYRLFGHTGFAQSDLKAPNLEARIAFYMRPGLHGVHTSDWTVGRAFLARWFAAPAPTPLGGGASGPASAGR